MRSDLVFSALGPAPARYRLCRLTAKASRKLHTRKSRIQDTLNDVLSLLSNSSRAGGSVTDREEAVRKLINSNPPALSASSVEMARELHRVAQMEI